MKIKIYTVIREKAAPEVFGTLKQARKYAKEKGGFSEIYIQNVEVPINIYRVISPNADEDVIFVSYSKALRALEGDDEANILEETL